MKNDTREENGQSAACLHTVNQIITGDARELSMAMPDESIDLIFTDPPYDRTAIPLYGWLSEIAARVLKPGGFCLAYVGSLYKFETTLELAKHLAYFWDYIALDTQRGAMIWPRNTVALHKSILAFVKGEGKPRCRTLGLWQGTGSDKRFHAWGQDESTARYYIDCFSSPGDTIWEPFCGGGTVPVVCKQIKRNFIAFEVDPATAATARKRLETTQPLLMPEEIPQLKLMMGSEGVA